PDPTTSPGATITRRLSAAMSKATTPTGDTLRSYRPMLRDPTPSPTEQPSAPPRARKAQFAGMDHILHLVRALLSGTVLSSSSAPPCAESLILGYTALLGRLALTNEAWSGVLAKVVAYHFCFEKKILIAGRFFLFASNSDAR